MASAKRFSEVTLTLTEEEAEDLYGLIRAHVIHNKTSANLFEVEDALSGTGINHTEFDAVPEASYLEFKDKERYLGI